jgi:hypothetical protein
MRLTSTQFSQDQSPISLLSNVSICATCLYMMDVYHLLMSKINDEKDIFIIIIIIIYDDGSLHDLSISVLLFRVNFFFSFLPLHLFILHPSY